jgi:hypothetical protein
MALHEEDLTQEQLLSRFAQLENFAMESRDRYHELQQQLKELTQVMAASLKPTSGAAATPTPTSTPKPAADETRDVKIATPDAFTGNRSKLRAFLSQLEITFSLSPNRFNDEQKKVLYVISLLRDGAFNWVEPMLRARQKSEFVPELQDFESLATALEKMFGDIDAQATAERKIEKLRQTASARAYVAEFRQAASHLTWGDEALSFKFYMGLKEAVKDRIAEQARPNGLAELMQLAVRIDDRLYERTLERKAFESLKGRQQPYTPPNSTPTSRTQTPEPMDWQASATNQGRRPHLSPEERQRRFELGLCFYCGSDQHKQYQCPDKTKNPGPPRQQTRPLRAAATNTARTTQEERNILTPQTQTPTILAVPRTPSISTIEFETLENE